jgi:hypothetical protein
MHLHFQTAQRWKVGATVQVQRFMSLRLANSTKLQTVIVDMPTTCQPVDLSFKGWFVKFVLKLSAGDKSKWHLFEPRDCNWPAHFEIE